MEIKEYLKIIRKNLALFLITTVGVTLAILSYFYFQPITYDTSLTLNITRSGIQKTSDYRYDDFYRLQADEKFADTIVEWLASPRIVADIYAKAGENKKGLDLKKLAKKFSVEKRSTQIVAVSFSSSSPKSAQKIANSLVKILSQNTQELNKNQQEANWFQIMAKKPITAKHNFHYKIIFLVALAVGIFLSFWVVMIKYYFE